MDRLQEPPSIVIANASGKFCRMHANISNKDALVVWYRSGLRLGADVKLSRILMSAPYPVKTFSRPIIYLLVSRGSRGSFDIRRTPFPNRDPAFYVLDVSLKMCMFDEPCPDFIQPFIRTLYLYCDAG